MTFICEEVIHDAKGVVIAKEPQDLINIRDPHYAAVLWKRKFQTDFQNWIDELETEKLPHGRLVLPTQKIDEAVGQLCDIAGMEDNPNRELLINDIASLSQLFAAVMEVQYLRLRLEKVNDNACRKLKYNYKEIHMFSLKRFTTALFLTFAFVSAALSSN